MEKVLAALEIGCGFSLIDYVYEEVQTLAGVATHVKRSVLTNLVMATGRMKLRCIIAFAERKMYKLLNETNHEGVYVGRLHPETEDPDGDAGGGTPSSSGTPSPSGTTLNMGMQEVEAEPDSRILRWIEDVEQAPPQHHPFAGRLREWLHSLNRLADLHAEHLGDEESDADEGAAPPL